MSPLIAIFLFVYSIWFVISRGLIAMAFHTRFLDFEKFIPWRLALLILPITGDMIMFYIEHTSDPEDSV